MATSQQLWKQCTSNKLHSVQPVVGLSVSLSLGRYDSVLINRLRIGHTRLTNSYLLKGESQPVCEACHSPLTVKHILVDCTHYSAARQRYFGVARLKDVFENVASRNIIAYVKVKDLCKKTVQFIYQCKGDIVVVDIKQHKSLGIWGSVMSSASWVRGGAPVKKQIWCILSVTRYRKYIKNLCKKLFSLYTV